VVVFVLVREDQNEHGYIDTSVAGMFRDERDAASEEVLQRHRAVAAGLIVEDEECTNPAWQTAWRIGAHDSG